MRAVQKSSIPIWHTEGFNPHPFITFPLPLSLGFKGERECMDIRLIEDDYPLEILPDKLNNCLPNGINVFSAAEAKMKAKDIKYALFEINIISEEYSADFLYDTVLNVLNMDKLIVVKKSKSKEKEIDEKKYLSLYEVLKTDFGVKIIITLPAGSEENINPNLIVTAIENESNIEMLSDIVRKNIFNEKGEQFE